MRENTSRVITEEVGPEAFGRGRIGGEKTQGV